MPSRWLLSRWLPVRWLPFGGSRSRTVRRPVPTRARPRYRLSFEALEDRVTPAGSFSLSGTLLTITGDPAGNNNFQFSESASLVGGNVQKTYTFILNGQTQSYTDSQVTGVVVNAPGHGDNAGVVTNDSYLGADGAMHALQHVIVLGQGLVQVYDVGANGAPTLFMQMNGINYASAIAGHADVAVLQASAGQQNTYVSAGTFASLTSPYTMYQITGAGMSYGFAATAQDGAVLEDGTGPSNLTISGIAYSEMSGTDNGQSFLNIAYGFHTNQGVDQHGNGDTATFYDSPATDVFTGTATLATMYSDNADGSLNEFDTAQGFAQVNAYSFVGGTDFEEGVDSAVDNLGSSWVVMPSSSAGATQILQLNLNPIDLNLLGLEVQTNAIQVTVSAQPGQGELLGNLLSTVGNLLNLGSVNNALNNVLGNVVTLLNSASLNVAGANTTSGQLAAAPASAAATTPVLDLFVAPVHLNLLGALVDTSPIHLTITAHSGPGLILGNVVADLANLFNPPLPSTLNLDTVNADLQNLISELSQQIPGITPAPVTTPTATGDTQQILALTLAPIDVNLLGLVLKTSQIQVNADAITGNGDLLGNVLTTLLNTLGATPQNLQQLNTNLNTLLGQVIGVLNASSLVLPSNAVSTLSQTLQTLALPNLVNSSGTASAPILNLTIAQPDGSGPPVNVNLLGLKITTSNIQAQLLAQTGNGQILGNLLYNVANLLNPGGSATLLGLLSDLGV